MEKNFSIKEIMSFETALSYAGVAVEDVVECDKGDDAYHFTYKEHINVNKFNIADVESKKIKTEETSIYTIPLGIGVVTDIMYGKHDESVLGGFSYTDIIKETKTYTIDFVNPENVDYEERTLYNGLLLEENKKMYNVPENFSLSDGAFVLKENSIKKK